VSSHVALSTYRPLALTRQSSLTGRVETRTPIDVPGGSDTFAGGINSAGQIVGLFFDGSGVGHGFLDTGGVFTPIDAPGAPATQAFGINATGETVGVFSDSDGTHGFLATQATVPEPGSLLLYATAVLLAGVASRRPRVRKRSLLVRIRARLQRS
jgi:hypothetical protein